MTLDPRPLVSGRPLRGSAPERPQVTVAGEAVDGELSEEQLVARARRGDRGAAEQLALHCRRPAFLLALQLLRNREDALDVAQDALLRFFSRLDRLRPGAPVRPWLFAIVRNRARDLQRRRRVRRHQPLSGDDPEGGVELVDPAPRPDADAARAELQVRVWRALADLSEAHREVLVLRDYQDLSYPEIAAILRVPVGTVMSRLHRARRALRDHLTEADPPPPDSARGRNHA